MQEETFFSDRASRSHGSPMGFGDQELGFFTVYLGECITITFKGLWENKGQGAYGHTGALALEILQPLKPHR